MPHQGAQSARAIAVQVLNQCDPCCGYAWLILNRLLDQTQQKQRATDLVFGTIRNRFAIDKVIATFSGQPVRRIPAKLLNIIRLATYEIVYCPETPEYSIVNEAVENAKALSGKKSAKGGAFVNAVLRQIIRHISSRQIQLDQADGRRTLPQTPQAGCQFDQPFLPDPQAAPADYLATTFSLPRCLITDWLNEFGLEETRRICFASNRRPSIYIRPNTLKITIERLAQKIRQLDADIEIVPEQAMIKVKSPKAVTDLPGFAEGEFSIQDISSSQAVKMLAPQPGWRILDLCAAPGVKTTQLAEAANDSATILATDINAERLQQVKENAARLGIKNISTIPYEDIEKDPAQLDRFDAILLDVPCSNTGVLARRVESRFRLRQNTIAELTGTQAELLQKAAALVKPGGKICYSTCSIQKAENADLVGQFLQHNPDFKLEFEAVILPSAERFDHDGGYVAIIIRK